MNGTATNMWVEKYNTIFRERILERFKDKILLEVAGHEHFGDIRYSHKGSDNKEFLKENEKDISHLLVVCPSVSPDTWVNPGYATFNLDENNLIVKDLNFTFLHLESTYNSTLAYPNLSFS